MISGNFAQYKRIDKTSPSPLLINITIRGVVRLSTPGGQESNISSIFPHSLRFSLIFLQFFSIFLLNLELRVSGPPTREDLGYATDCYDDRNASMTLLFDVRGFPLIGVSFILTLSSSDYYNFQRCL